MVAITTTITALLAAFACTASARPNPSPLSADPAGAKNIGNGSGAQFIGGACLSSADCASKCCATLAGAGICSGLGAQFQAGKTGCGFGDGGAAAPAAPPAAPATSSTAAVVQPTAAPNVRPDAGAGAGADTGAGAGAGNASQPGSQNVGKGNGSQFITGQCLSDADCQSGCCAKPKGVCSAVAVQFESGKQGCGFGAA